MNQWIVISSEGYELGTVPGATQHAATVEAIKRNLAEMDHLHPIDMLSACHVCGQIEAKKREDFSPAGMWKEWVSKHRYAESVGGHKSTWLAGFEAGRKSKEMEIEHENKARESSGIGRVATAVEAKDDLSSDSDQAATVSRRRSNQKERS